MKVTLHGGETHEQRKARQPKEGDTVVAVPPYALACGSGLYARAVCVQVDPQVLVSEEGDMLWYATLYFGCVESIGRAPKKVFEVAMARFERDKQEKSCPFAKVKT